MREYIARYESKNDLPPGIEKIKYGRWKVKKIKNKGTAYVNCDELHLNVIGKSKENEHIGGTYHLRYDISDYKKARMIVGSSNSKSKIEFETELSTELNAKIKNDFLEYSKVELQDQIRIKMFVKSALNNTLEAKYGLTISNTSYMEWRNYIKIHQLEQKVRHIIKPELQELAEKINKNSIKSKENISDINSKINNSNSKIEDLTNSLKTLKSSLMTDKEFYEIINSKTGETESKINENISNLKSELEKEMQKYNHAIENSSTNLETQIKKYINQKHLENKKEIEEKVIKSNEQVKKIEKYMSELDSNISSQLIELKNEIHTNNNILNDIPDKINNLKHDIIKNSSQIEKNIEGNINKNNNGKAKREQYNANDIKKMANETAYNLIIINSELYDIPAYYYAHFENEIEKILSSSPNTSYQTLQNFILSTHEKIKSGGVKNVMA